MPRRRSGSSTTSGSRRSSWSARPVTSLQATGRSASGSPRSIVGVPGALRLSRVREGRPRAPLDARDRHGLRRAALHLLREGSRLPAGAHLRRSQERDPPARASADRRNRRFRLRRLPDLLAHRCRLALALAAGRRSSASGCSSRCATAYQRDGRLYDRYDRMGRSLSKLEALPLYATAHSLADVVDQEFAEAAEREARRALAEGARRPRHALLPPQLALVRRDALARARADASTSCWASSIPSMDARSRRASRSCPFFACLLFFPLVLLAGDRASAADALSRLSRAGLRASASSISSGAVATR